MPNQYHSDKFQSFSRLYTGIVLLYCLNAACGPDLHRTGGATDYSIRRIPPPIVSAIYCEPNSPIKPWADCVERCLPLARVSVVCHKNAELPPNYFGEPGATNLAHVPTGEFCGDTPSFRVLALQPETRTYDMLDGGAMGAWSAADLAGCSVAEPEVDPFFYENRVRQAFYTGQALSD